MVHHARGPAITHQVYVPHDGKRLRLRNTPRAGDSMGIELKLVADKRVRLVTTDLVSGWAHYRGIGSILLLNVERVTPDRFILV